MFPPSPAAMNYAEYVLCKWKKRLWPAKVLSRETASKRQQACKDVSASLQVEILGRHIQANVRCKDVELLNEERIKDIASKLDQTVKGHKVMEELAYRRALREALDTMRQGVPSKERSPSKTGRSKLAAWKKTTDRSSSIQAAVRQQPSPNKKRKKRGKTCEAPAELPIVGTPNKRRRYPREKAEGSTSAKSLVSKSGDLLGNGDSEGQPRCAPKTKKPEKPKKGVRLKTSSGPSANRRSPRFSKVDEKHHRDKSPRERSSRSSTAKRSVRMSTPARACHRAKLTPEKKTGGKQGKVLSEREQFPPRKYRKVSEGQRHPQGSPGTLQKRTPSLSRLCRETCANGHEASACSSDPVGPSLDCIQEENLCPSEDKAENSQRCNFEDKAGPGSPSDPALRPSPIREPCPSSGLGDEVEAEDDKEEELPSILLHQEPCSIEAGKLVWCKLLRNPYWPAVVKSVKQKVKKASVLIIDKQMDAKKSKGFSTSLRNLKHFDCEEKQTLIDKAKERYRDEINWCINLITDYRIRVACHSFTGTFLEYCEDDMSYPVRKETHHCLSQVTSPQREAVDSEEAPSEATPTKPAKKVLPDRMRVARDKANEKIVEFIVKAKGADEHLRAILKSKKQSRWLKKFLKPSPHQTCIETYLEDDNQQELVLKYLQDVYQEIDAKLLPLSNGDSIKFILDVLFPEAIIYAISAVYQIDYKEAEEKYSRGPSHSQREREMFEEEILEKKRKQHLQRPAPCPDDSM